MEAKGSYTLPGNTNILHVINSANGIAENGSFRDIQILRDGETVKVFDLYDVFISGDLETSFQFRSGDLIKVGFLNQQVSISGGINNPAIYEFKDGETLKNIVSFAGGFTPYADLNRIEIKEAISMRGVSKTLTKDNYSGFKIKPMDNIFVYSFKPSAEKGNYCYH